MAITNVDQYGFSPTFEIDPYEDPRLDSLGNPVATVTNAINAPQMPQHGYDNITQNLSTIPSSIDITKITTNTSGIWAPTAMLVQGKMLTTSISMSPYEAEQMDDIELKNRLITMMVREIMDNKCIEFTKQKDYAKDEVVIRARIYVTPDSDVKVIRQMQI